MATTQLRPMALGEILDASFALLRPAAELNEQTKRRREALAHDRDAEEDAGMAPQQCKRRIQDLA